MATTEEHVRRFVSLQRELLAQLSEHVDLSAPYFNDLKPGRLLCHDETWSYRGHGAGVTFERNDEIINVHVVPQLRDVVDAWRLSVYFEGRGIRIVEHRGALLPVEDEGAVAVVLERLTNEGWLTPVWDGKTTHRFYRVKSPVE